MNLKIDKNDLRRKTALLYENIHPFGESADDPISREARGSAISAQALRLPPDFFKGKICLDAGCGGCNEQIQLALLEGARQVHGIDLSFENVRNADHKYTADVAQNRAVFVHGDISQLPYRDNTFEFAYSNGVLNHVLDPSLCIMECFRCLKAGGYLFLNAYGKGGFLRWSQKALRFFHTRLIPYSFARNIYSKLFTPFYVMSLLDAFFTPIEHTFYFRDIEHILLNTGFTNIIRLDTPNYHQSYIARFLFPQANDYRTLYSRVMFGSGYISAIAQKPESKAPSSPSAPTI